VFELFDGAPVPLREGNVTLSTAIAFEFAGSDDAGVVGFECSLDRAGFEACTSPITFERLGRGPHTFRARAVEDRRIRDPNPPVFVWSRR
jgi:hypothetical protein